jgi:Tetratricopeptide repeat
MMHRLFRAGTTQWKGRAACFILLVMVITPLAFQANTQTQKENDLDVCKDSGDPQRRIAACSSIIAAAKRSDIQVADIFMRRASAYFDKGDYDKAIADYDSALQLKPDVSRAVDWPTNARVTMIEPFRISIRPFDLTQISPRLITTVDERTSEKTNSSKHFKISIRPSDSIPTLLIPTIIAPRFTRSRATQPALCRISIGPSSSILISPRLWSGEACCDLRTTITIRQYRTSIGRFS